MSVKNKTVQQKMTELNEMVAWFQSPDFSLEEALDRYKLAEQLAEEIQTDLTNLKNDISVIKRRFEQEGE